MYKSDTREIIDWLPLLRGSFGFRKRGGGSLKCCAWQSASKLEGVVDGWIEVRWREDVESEGKPPHFILNPRFSLSAHRRIVKPCHSACSATKKNHM